MHCIDKKIIVLYLIMQPLALCAMEEPKAPEITAGSFFRIMNQVVGTGQKVVSTAIRNNELFLVGASGLVWMKLYEREHQKEKVHVNVNLTLNVSSSDAHTSEQIEHALDRVTHSEPKARWVFVRSQEDRAFCADLREGIETADAARGLSFITPVKEYTGLSQTAADEKEFTRFAAYLDTAGTYVDVKQATRAAFKMVPSRYKERVPQAVQYVGERIIDGAGSVGVATWRRNTLADEERIAYRTLHIASTLAKEHVEEDGMLHTALESIERGAQYQPYAVGAARMISPHICGDKKDSGIKEAVVATGIHAGMDFTINQGLIAAKQTETGQRAFEWVDQNIHPVAQDLTREAVIAGGTVATLALVKSSGGSCSIM